MPKGTTDWKVLCDFLTQYSLPPSLPHIAQRKEGGEKEGRRGQGMDKGGEERKG
jgi:hypothetical protein